MLFIDHLCLSTDDTDLITDLIELARERKTGLR